MRAFDEACGNETAGDMQACALQEYEYEWLCEPVELLSFCFADPIKSKMGA